MKSKAGKKTRDRTRATAVDWSGLFLPMLLFEIDASA